MGGQNVRKYIGKASVLGHKTAHRSVEHRLLEPYDEVPMGGQNVKKYIGKASILGHKECTPAILTETFGALG